LKTDVAAFFSQPEVNARVARRTAMRIGAGSRAL
jgi:hypothetical protein